MPISEVYTLYKILPSLQMHMYRVAMVGKIIAEHCSVTVDKEAIVKALLLHDTGNILKFNLALYPELFEPEGIFYWQGVKDEYIQKYGTDEHTATITIAKSIGISKYTLELLLSVGFTNAKTDLESKDIAKMICCYADQRVAIFGVQSLQDRIFEGRSRHIQNKGDDKKDFEATALILNHIEEQIFSYASITPEFIIDDLVSHEIQKGYLQQTIIP